MRRSRFTVEQIIGFLKENAAGASVRSLCRKYGFSEPIFYRWKAKYSGMNASEARRLRELEEQNRQLKQIVGDLTLDNQALRELLSKNF
jgi:putative transposase